MKTAIFLRSSLLATFCEEEHLRLRVRNSILMTLINVYIINPVQSLGSKCKICSILHFFWLILLSVVLSANELQLNSSQIDELGNCFLKG